MLQLRGRRTVSRTGLRAAASAAWRKERSRAVSVRELLGWRQRSPCELDSSAASTQEGQRDSDAAASRQAQVPTASAACMTDKRTEMEPIGEAANCWLAVLSFNQTRTQEMLGPRHVK
jgi:hypothetical protein